MQDLPSVQVHRHQALQVRLHTRVKVSEDPSPPYIAAPAWPQAIMRKRYSVSLISICKDGLFAQGFLPVSVRAVPCLLLCTARVCDACVRKRDHHCVWLGTSAREARVCSLPQLCARLSPCTCVLVCSWTGTCVGERNYTSFFVTVCGAVALCGTALGFCAYRIVAHRDDKLHLSRRWGLRPGLLVQSEVVASCASWLVAVVCLLFLVPLTGLLTAHIRQVRAGGRASPRLCGKLSKSGLGRADASLEDSIHERLLLDA